MTAFIDSHCALCGAEFVSDGFTTGYGTRFDGTRVCYACCAVTDLADMEATGKATLYLTGTEIDGYTVTNWPGTLRFPVGDMRKGRHNIARTRYDVWFMASGRLWHGVQYGENTQVAHCRRVKAGI